MFTPALRRPPRSRTPSTCARTGCSDRACARASSQGLPELGADLRALVSPRTAGVRGRAGGRLPVRLRERGRRGALRRRALDRSGRQRELLRGDAALRPAVPRSSSRRPRSIRSGPTRLNTPFVLGGRERAARLRDQRVPRDDRCWRPRRDPRPRRSRSSRSVSAALLFYDVGDAAPSFADLDAAQRRRARAALADPAAQLVGDPHRLGGSPPGRPRHARRHAGPVSRRATSKCSTELFCFQSVNRVRNDRERRKWAR